ncbi:MAG: hypothetical protein WCS43_16155 [Verrucomicrobiota bacterium]
MSDDNTVTEEDCAQRFMISTRNLFEAIRSKIRVERRTLEVFSGQLQLVDHDTSGTVNWWHRNQPHKPWAVNVLLPDGRGFFPDFLVGVNGRKTEDHVLLAEPKFHFERALEAPKADVAHGSYGKVLVLHRDGNAEWRVVRLEGKDQRPVLGDKMRVADMAGWGL